MANSKGINKQLYWENSLGDKDLFITEKKNQGVFGQASLFKGPPKSNANGASR